MKQGQNHKAPRKLVEKYEKLTESMFVHINRIYLKKKKIPEPFKTKQDIYSTLYEPMLDFYLKGTDSKIVTHQQYSSRSIAGILKGID